MIPIYLSLKKDVPATGYWDHAFIKDIFADIEGTVTRQVFVIPGAYQSDMYYEINEQINKFPKVMVIITSDEEGKFDASKLYHPDMILYSQYGTSENIFPLGYAPGTREWLQKLGPLKKELKYFFSGQITHPIRQQMASVMEHCNGGIFLPTDGFAKGLNHEAYVGLMAVSQIVPAPPGPISHDSFRLYEALEAGCVPVVCDNAPSGRVDYWNRLFGEDIFPISCDKYLKQMFDGCETHFLNSSFAWWQLWKYNFKLRLKKQLGIGEEETSVVIPTSPIKSHPSTEIIDQTIASVRRQMDSTIFILIDGVRKEQQEYLEKYDQYISKLLWKCNFEYKNVVPILFPHHVHQSGMMKHFLNMVDTEFILFVEHDTPLVTDLPFDWDKIKDSLRDQYDLVRFHFESFIPEEHRYLMVGEVENGFQKTIQFSARPHLARTDFYRRLMERFSDNSNCFIEDRAYGQIVEEPWDNWKMAIYHPEGIIKRSLNLDGRQGDQKYDSQQVW